MTEPRRRSTLVTRTASPIRGEQRAHYRCDECRALLLDGDDVIAHMGWHDRLLHVDNPTEST